MRKITETCYINFTDELAVVQVQPVDDKGNVQPIPPVWVVLNKAAKVIYGPQSFEACVEFVDD